MRATGVTAVVMIVSGLRRMWRSERPVRTVVSLRTWVADMSVLLPGVVRLADEGEEDVFEARLLLDVLDLGRRQQPLELVEGAVLDDAALVEDRDAVGELLGLVEVLGRQEHGGAGVGEVLDGVPDLDA